MNYNNYSADKASGRVELVRAGGGYAIARKRWDSLTGNPIQPEIIAISEEDIEASKASLEAQVAEHDAILSDLASLPE